MRSIISQARLHLDMAPLVFSSILYQQDQHLIVCTKFDAVFFFAFSIIKRGMNCEYRDEVKVLWRTDYSLHLRCCVTITGINIINAGWYHYEYTKLIMKLFATAIATSFICTFFTYIFCMSITIRFKTNRIIIRRNKWILIGQRLHHNLKIDIVSSVFDPPSSFVPPAAAVATTMVAW